MPVWNLSGQMIGCGCYYFVVDDGKRALCLVPHDPDCKFAAEAYLLMVEEQKPVEFGANYFELP
jgi:hypothetical protein